MENVFKFPAVKLRIVIRIVIVKVAWMQTDYVVLGHERIESLKNYLRYKT